ASYSDGIYSRTYAAEGEKLPFTVRENAFFILGDNREDAEDSRIQGQISKRNIKGRIVTVIRRRQI
ncbi:MAG: signal peptidase I, partial [Mogibacterium sp.]|nr:signal peptidase I [Mogibacterium sp.]